MSGIGYTYQNPIVLIGSKSGTTRTPSALTATASDNAKTFDTKGMSKTNLSILYTTGAGETSNTLNITVESSPDNTNFYQIVNESASSGTSTLFQRSFVFTGTDAATAYSYSLPLDIQDKFMKISVSEGGVITNFGTVYVEAMLSGAR